MSQENLERFREAVLADPGLQERLRATRDREAFAELVVRLGGERGYVFTAEDVAEAMREGRRAWLEQWV